VAKNLSRAQDDVTPYKHPAVDGLVRATIAATEYSVFIRIAQANAWAELVAPLIAQSDADTIYLGLDTENNR
jgi:hypothetical protein